ncbi:MAG: hypothetical protein ACU84Q_06845 [Gammaproteobacteria bacterium]
MKIKLVKSLVFGAALSFGNAFAVFDADYEVTNWTQSAGAGSIDPTSTPLNVLLTSGNDGIGSQINTISSISITATGTLSVNWNDARAEGNSCSDPLG